jgi:hypothetical protein
MEPDTNNIWQEYEIRKANIPTDLTGAEYEIAVAEIVEDLGL